MIYSRVYASLTEISRCTAEFCMICGLKWKSCNCPWFNYDAVEQDRLNYMQIPMPVLEVREPLDGVRAVQPLRARRRARGPQNYDDEMRLRRRQERVDEILARRLQRLALESEDDYQGGIGDIHGIGNAAGHFMNEDFIRVAQNVLTGHLNAAARDRIPAVDPIRGEARPAPPIVRRHTLREAPITDPRPGRSAERIIPRRTRTDYATEAAIHAPLSRLVPQRTTSSSSSSSKRRSKSPPSSVLAGLNSRSDRGRVDMWRTHVEPVAEVGESV